jgi:transposase
MQTITTIGLDIAKSVFQVHGVDGRPRDRSPAIEASLCPDVLPEAVAMSGRYRSLRVVAPLDTRVAGAGSHRAVDPASLCKPYVKRQKNDAADAETICEAVTRANMRFVPTKNPEQQSGLVLHRKRHLFIRQQTVVINAIRARLAEFGIVAPVGRHGVEELLTVVADPNDERVPETIPTNRHRGLPLNRGAA